jgi:micrococcal nuclease
MNLSTNFRLKCLWHGGGLSLFALLLAIWPSLALAAERPILCAPVRGGAGKVVGVSAPLTLKLDTGDVVRLAEVGLPGAWATKTPSTELSLSALKSLALSRHVQLYFDGLRKDRHGRVLAQVMTANGVWLQRALVARGAALVDTWTDDRACGPTLLTQEARARAGEEGLWSDPANRPIPVDKAAGAIDRFAIIEGRILRAEKTGGRVYLNFGKDWKTDFTVWLSPSDLRRFVKAGIDPLSLQGKRVRVRGYVTEYHGPEIEATHPEMLEVLGGPTE